MKGAIIPSAAVHGFGRFRLLQEIGEGGFGIVYAGTSPDGRISILSYPGRTPLEEFPKRGSR